MLEKVISEIENGFYTKDVLAELTQKDIFSVVLASADNLASIVNKLSDKSPELPSSKESLDRATTCVYRIFDIDKDTLVELCDYSGLNKKQIKSLVSACDNKNKSIDKAVCNLFEATALETDLISYHKNKALFKKSGSNTEALGQFDSFIEYIVTTGTNSVVLEQIARLSIYQKQQLGAHLEQNLKLNNIYTKYVETGKITKTDIDYAKKQIEKGILKNLKENPIQVMREMDGTTVARTIDKSAIKETFVTGKAPGTFIDAWGVSEGNLLGYCVTDNDNFNTQFNQIVRIADGIENGLKKGVLDNVREYELKGFCKSFLGEDDEQTSALNTQINEMLSNQKINKQEYMALKYSSVNKEMLNILRLTPEKLYEKIEGKISLGFHSDSSPLLSVKNKATQVKTSTDAIFNAIEVMVKISKENPTLHKIEGVYSKVANNLAEGFSMAYTANFLNGTSKENSDAFEKAERSLSEIGKVMRRANLASAQNFRFSVDKDFVIMDEYQEINSTYSSQQEAINVNDITDQGFLKLTTAKHDVKINAANVNTILGGHYTAIVPQSLFIDCLKFKVDAVIKNSENSPSGNIHLGSTKQIVKAYKEGMEKGFDLSEVVGMIKSNEKLLNKMVEISGDLVIEVPKRSKMKP